MDKAVAKLLAAAVSIASMGLSACESHSGSADTSSGQPGPAPAAEDAYRQLHDANNVSECGTLLSALNEANGKRDIPALRDVAGKYRAQVATWDDLLAKTSFPPAARPVVDSLRANNAQEMQHLDSVAAVTEASLGNVLATYVFFDNARVTTDLDLLADELGRPSSPTLNAADQLELARQTYQRDNALTNMLFAEALTRGDLNAAKAANRVEEEALGRYAQALDSIAWPPGYDEQVNDLRDKIQALIDFDRRQVDVSNVSEIVPAPPEGTPQGAAESQAETKLYDALNKANNGDVLPKC